MKNNNTKHLDRQEKSLVNQLNQGWSTHHQGIWQSHGINESVFVTYIWFWTKHNSKKLKNYRDGRTWTYDSLPNLSSKLGNWTVDQLRTVIKNCVQKGLVVVGNYNELKGDKTSWYALTDYALTQCQIADANPLIENFQEMHDKDLEIFQLKAEIALLKSASSTEKQASGKNTTGHHNHAMDNQDSSGEPTRPSGKFPAALPDIQPEILREEYIKKVCLIGNSQSQESPSKKQTSFKDINDLEHPHPQIEAIDTFSPLKGNSDLSTTCAVTYSQSAPIDHMLSNSHGCSEVKIKAYAESRRQCGATLTQSAWDKSVKTCLEMVKEKTKLTPDQAMDVLIARKDGNTRFHEIFSFATNERQIELFEQEALAYTLSRGQEEESVRLEFERIAIKHGIKEGYDFDNLLIRFYNKPIEHNDIENQQADTFLESLAKTPAKTGRYTTSEPEYRRAMQAKASHTAQESLKIVGNAKSQQWPLESILMKEKESMGDCANNRVDRPCGESSLTVEAFMASIHNKIHNQSLEHKSQTPIEDFRRYRAW